MQWNEDRNHEFPVMPGGWVDTHDVVTLIDDTTMKNDIKFDKMWGESR